MKHSKIAIIGAGLVGSTTAYALLLKNIAAEIILVDVNEVRCRGELLDLSDALTFDGTSLIRIGNAHDASQADIIIIAAGKAQKPHESRTDLLQANILIFDAICKEITPINPQAIVIIVTNPVDLMTLHIQEKLNLPRKQIIGSGTFLDSQRLRGLLSRLVNVSQQSINVSILGEHGETQFVAWSTAEIAGTPLLQFPGITQEKLTGIAQEVKDKAQEIISCKGATYYGIAACVAEICKIIMFNQKTAIPVSTYIEEYNICLSVPVVIGESGIENLLPLTLNAQEKQQFINSAKQLQSFQK